MGRQSFAEVVKNKAPKIAENLSFDHGSSVDGVWSRNEIGGDGPKSAAFTLSGIKTTFPGKGLVEACEEVSEGPYFNKTLRIELSKGSGRKVYWVLVRKPKKGRPSQDKVKVPGPINAFWRPKNTVSSDGWKNRAQSPIASPHGPNPFPSAMGLQSAHLGHSCGAGLSRVRGSRAPSPS